MDAQSEYFAENPQSPFLDVAGNNHRAFNEFIRVGCEQGAVGLLLAGGFLLSLFGKSRAGRFRDPIRGGILALLVFSFFSYTSDIYPLKFYYALLPGLLRLRPLRTATVPAVGRGVAVALVLAVAGMAVRFQGRYERASDRLQDYMRSPSEESLNRVKDCLPGRDLSPRFHVGILPASLSEPAVLRLPGRIPRLSCPCAEDVGNAVRSGKRLFERLRVP